MSTQTAPTTASILEEIVSTKLKLATPEITTDDRLCYEFDSTSEKAIDHPNTKILEEQWVEYCGKYSHWNEIIIATAKNVLGADKKITVTSGKGKNRLGTTLKIWVG